MQDNYIDSLLGNPPLSFVDRLREQFQERYNLIVHHEWMIDLLNSKLTFEQFEAFVSQESYIYDLLARKLISLALESTDDEYEDLMKVGFFLYSEGCENRKSLDTPQALLLSCPTEQYVATLNKVWRTSSTNNIQKLLTILSTLWIREGIHQLLNTESYRSQFPVWTDIMATVNPQEHIMKLSKMINQAFEELLEVESRSCAEAQQELEHLLSNLTQFELLIRNHAYQP
ncbi:MAG: hypothetical protein BGO76_01640 [Caedibacter sp. 38-128]|nr:hypothetical protein [Holosporales bacterium]OJX05118.1 MAG: hypothetical protein BGO76_01640 [Caedibacter sp. 38-128]